MKFNQVTHGIYNATVYIYQFDLDKENITPRLFICAPNESKSLSTYVNELSGTMEPVIAINGGLFNTFAPYIHPLQIAVKNQQVFNSDNQVEILDLLFDSSNNFRIERTDSSYINDTSISWIRSGAFTLIENGSAVVYDPLSSYYHLISEYSARTAIGVDSTFKKVTIVSTKTGSLNGQELQEVMSTYGDHVNAAVALDGGNSTTLWANGEIKVNRYSIPLAERPISDAIIFTRNKTSNVSGYSLRAKNTQFCIREHVVSGNILHTVTTGLSAEIVQFIPEFQTDGYQWARVKYQVGSNTIYGYSQLDTSSDYQVIKTNNNASTIYLKAITTSFRVRDCAVNGSTLEVVPVGQKARINALATGFASDGYQWANVTYNGVTGWSQLDLQGAYTIVEG